jgi:MFS transporter, MCT family, solute carrier family 16 (monocarboxylic acid transporters), member 14
LCCSVFGLAYLPIEPTVVSDIHDDEKEKKSLMGDSLHSPAFKTPEGRFAYSVPNSSHSTWIGTANNTNYPTAAEIFKGSGANLDRRPSQNSGMLTQGNIHSTTKKLEQFKQAQKRPGHMTPTTPESVDFPHPPSVLQNHHELGPVGEAEEVEESESGNLLNKEIKPTIVANSGRRHTVSGRQKGTESLTGSRKGSKHDVSRPLYRDDIFFSGSMNKLPQYRSQTSIGYHMSVTHIPTFKDVEEEDNDDSCKLCPEAVRRTLSTMLDTSLLKDVSFLFLIFSGFFTMMGFFVPFMYITDRAKASAINEKDAVFFISAIGIANTIARILFGWLSSFEGVNALHLNNSKIIQVYF